MAREEGVRFCYGRRTAAWGALAGTALLAQYLPSTAALGQWGPAETLPLGLCRWRGPAQLPRVALTFDDGPDPRSTPRVLDALDRLDVRATFFLVGARARAHPELVEEVARRGHEVASHGDRHVSHLLRPPWCVRQDLERARATLAGLGCDPSWYRPPYGHVTGATLVAARAAGLATVLWSAWGREWTSSSPHEVAARVVRRLRPGAIVLLHDGEAFGPPGMSKVVLGALPLVADALDRAGLEPVTLSGVCAARPLGKVHSDVPPAIGAPR